METDQLINATLAYSPAAASGETWHYASGNWVECPSTEFNVTLCDQQLHIRSPCGLFGYYPYMDRVLQYYSVFATIDSNFVDSYYLVRSVNTYISNSPASGSNPSPTPTSTVTPTPHSSDGSSNGEVTLGRVCLSLIMAIILALGSVYS